MARVVQRTGSYGRGSFTPDRTFMRRVVDVAAGVEGLTPRPVAIGQSSRSGRGSGFRGVTLNQAAQDVVASGQRLSRRRFRKFDKATGVESSGRFVRTGHMSNSRLGEYNRYEDSFRYFITRFDNRIAFQITNDHPAAFFIEYGNSPVRVSGDRYMIIPITEAYAKTLRSYKNGSKPRFNIRRLPDGQWVMFIRQRRGYSGYYIMRDALQLGTRRIRTGG